MEKRERPPETGLTAVVLVLSGIVLALHLAGSVSPGGLDWGFHFLGFLPRVHTVVVCLIFIALAAAAPRINLEAPVSRIAEMLQSKPLVFLACALAVMALAAFLFRVNVSLLGDSFTVINNFQEYERGVSPLQPWHEPLSMFFFYHALRAIGDLTFPGLFRSFFAIQLILGLLFVATTFLIVRLLFGDGRRRLLAFLFCLSSPYMIFFFGYIEIYAFSFLMLAVFTLVSLLAMEGKLPFALVPVVYVLAAFSHYLNGGLLVSVLYLALREYRGRRFGQLALGFAGAALIVLAALVRAGFDINRLMDIDPVSHRLSVSEGGSILDAYSQAYTLFSVYHFADIANYLVLMAPLSLGIVVWGAIRRGRALVKASPVNAWFVCALLPVFLYYFFAKLEQGNADDWDVFAANFLLLNLFAALVFFQSGTSREVNTFGLATAMSLLFSLPWLVLNAQSGPAVERFLSLWDRRNVSQLGQYTMALRLTRYYDAVNDPAGKPDVWRRYRGLFPDDPRGYGNEISTLGALPGDNSLRKLEVYEEWMTVDPLNRAVRHSYGDECANAGTRYHTLQKLDSAQFFYSRALLVDSTNARVLNNLGSVYAEEGRLDLAIAFFRKATLYDSSYSDAYYNLGIAYGESGEKEAGLAFVRKAAALGNPAARDVLKGRR